MSGTALHGSPLVRSPLVTKVAARPALVRVVSRIDPAAPVMLAAAAGFLLPLKAARVDVAGLSLYAAYFAAFVAWLRFPADVLLFARRLAAPFAVLTAFAVWGVLRGAGVVGPAVTLGKLAVAFAVVAAFAVLLQRAQHALYLGLLGGVCLSVAYMVYQSISALFFGFGLPYTSIAQLKVGYGLSQRYGLTRVTGFTEEPSFIATLLVGSTLLLIAYAWRTNRRGLLTVSSLLGAFGLAMSTSNNLIATTIILAGAWPLVRARRISLIMAAYYVAALVVTPLVLYRDITYNTRFLAYDIFRRSGPVEMVVGRGVGSYPAYFSANGVTFQGTDIESLASVWGGFLFEGGIVLVALVIAWLARIIIRTGWREGLALFALLLMLSNYNSPWWPLVSLALAQCLLVTRKDPPWTTTSISPGTPLLSVAADPSSAPSRSSARSPVSPSG